MYTVSIKHVARADLDHLRQFLAGKQPEASHDALQVLDIVLRELSAQRWDLFPRVYFSKKI